MQPRLLSVLRFVDVPGTDMDAGYIPLSEQEAIDELIQLLEGLKLQRTVFRANHSSNPIPLEGRFPKDREALIAGLKSLRSSLDNSGPGTLPLFL